jgi:hypothetical protein
MTSAVQIRSAKLERNLHRTPRRDGCGNGTPISLAYGDATSSYSNRGGPELSVRGLPWLLRTRVNGCCREGPAYKRLVAQK